MERASGFKFEDASQIRYFDYFDKVQCERFNPGSNPLTLKKIVLHGHDEDELLYVKVYRNNGQDSTLIYS